MADGEFMRYASGYAGRGWHVFPLLVQGKAPATSRGFKDATTDLELVQRWWSNQPKANIGIACGPSGLVVLDVDPRNGGGKSLAKLQELYEIPSTLRSGTGGGGMHFFFRVPEGISIRKSVLADGLDVVSSGGYVVAPPSVHPSGGRYAWVEGTYHREDDLALCPEWLVDFVKCPERNPFRDSEISAGFTLPDEDELEQITHGKRNTMLTRIAGAIRKWGLSDEAIDAALQLHNRQVCQPPLDEEEVRRIAKGITRYEPSLGQEIGQDGEEEGSGISIEGSPVL